MTWAKLSDTFIDDPGMLRLPRGVRLLYVEGVVWSCKHLTDGVIDGHVLPRLTDEPDALDAAKLLVSAGLWDETEDGWQVVDFLEDQPSREKVEKRLRETKERQDRWRRHRAGDHSLCIRGRYCPEGDVTRDETRYKTRESQRPDPSRPVPKGKGKDGAGARPPEGSAGAARKHEHPRAFTVSGPPAFDQLCGAHGRERSTCPFCRQEEQA